MSEYKTVWVKLKDIAAGPTDPPVVTVKVEALDGDWDGIREFEFQTYSVLVELYISVFMSPGDKLFVLNPDHAVDKLKRQRTVKTFLMSYDPISVTKMVPATWETT